MRVNHAAAEIRRPDASLIAVTDGGVVTDRESLDTVGRGTPDINDGNSAVGRCGVKSHHTGALGSADADRVGKDRVGPAQVAVAGQKRRVVVRSGAAGEVVANVNAGRG